MLRQALKPQELCGSGLAHDTVLKPLVERGFRVGLAASALVMLGLVFWSVGVGVAHAQDPSISNPSAARTNAFPSPPGGVFGNQAKINSAAPLYLQGDDLVYDTKGGRVIARGNVQIFYNNYLLTGDQITYDQKSNRLLAEGNVQLRDPNGNITRANRIEATDDFRDAFVESLSVEARDNTRITARRSVRRDGNVTEFEQGKFTPCKTDDGKPPLWCISAARIVHDQNAATITYQDATFDILGTPVIYMPYFQHPDPSVKHKSGFLMPSVGYSSSLGFMFEVPYYFALDRSYGLTFNPRVLSKQGVLLQGDWRQRLANGEYSVKFGAIHQDGGTLPDISASDAAKLDGWRGTVETRGTFSLGSWWKFGWDVTVESDKAFRRFYGFDSILQTDRVNQGYITGIGERNYFNTSLYHFGGLLTNDTDVAGSRVMPVVDYNYIANQPVLGGELGANFHARALQRSAGLSNSIYTPGTDTTHVVADVNWRRRLIDPIGQTWTPFANLRADALTFQDALINPTNPALGTRSDSVYRGVGSAGLTYAYPFAAMTPSASHIVEPVAQIITRKTSNTVDQRLLPNEDAKSVVWDDNSLFFESKSTGFDRIDEGTRFNYGTKYTFQANNGFHTRLVLGQSIHLDGNNVFADPGKDVTTSYVRDNFSAATGLEKNRSDYVAGLYVSPLQNLSIVAQGRFDSATLELRRQDTLVSAAYGPITTQLGYTYSRADSLLDTSTTKSTTQKEILASVGLKLSSSWSVLASMRYDIDQQFRLQDSIQLRYSDECFVLSATYFENFINNADLGIKAERAIMLRFDLKHLGSFNTRTDVTSFLSGGDNQSNK
ncbi:MAG: LPS-assembly protein LptD [Hyphomicrobiaceae bacterium]|nr:LPS-assembly protein LptD [Hyphomicrobiaceae bacterium]